MALLGIGRLAFADGSVDQFLGGALLFVGSMTVLPAMIVGLLTRQNTSVPGLPSPAESTPSTSKVAKEQ